MFLETYLFNLFFCLALSSALLVVFSSNAVYSVFFLILTFCNIIFILLFIGAEFFAFLLLIVYVGAIAVLFLFVIMMLNIKITKSSLLQNKLFVYSPLLFITFLFVWDYFYQFSNILNVYWINTRCENYYYDNWIIELNNLMNIKVIGKVLYNDYSLLFILSSFILLIAMIGVIILTVNQKVYGKAKKQKIEMQLDRKSKKTVKFIHLRKL
uniref:NADH dehydrogenase subunit 6 n=1 Tax=Bostrychia moritziana TaxID=103713 RepID=UPI002E79FA58|nr:NADH dehydrogenase subunit 6 [Bostrychia moritziana]WQF69391.1 NADH dehydrogenase subunit 6 [Bostrychia moritziana]